MAIKSIIGATCACLAAVSFNAGAVSVLDQVNDGLITANINGTATSLTWQQGVTAGATGLLSAIDLNFASAGTIDFFINVGAPWQTDANDYQDTSLSVVTGWNSIDISSANIFVNSGDEFVIGLTGLGIGNPDPWGSYSGGYVNGMLYLNGSVFVNSDSDLHFRTYVDVSAVPVPAAAWLFGSGLIGLIGIARRKTIKECV